MTNAPSDLDDGQSNGNNVHEAYSPSQLNDEAGVSEPVGPSTWNLDRVF
jgi:hypothetical protein